MKTRHICIFTIFVNNNTNYRFETLLSDTCPCGTFRALMHKDRSRMEYRQRRTSGKLRTEFLRIQYDEHILSVELGDTGRAQVLVLCGQPCRKGEIDTLQGRVRQRH